MAVPYNSFGAHLFLRVFLTVCIENHEPFGSEVELTLERGLPAMIAPSVQSVGLFYLFPLICCIVPGLVLIGIKKVQDPPKFSVQLKYKPERQRREESNVKELICQFNEM